MHVIFLNLQKRSLSLSYKWLMRHNSRDNLQVIFSYQEITRLIMIVLSYIFFLSISYDGITERTI